MNDPTPTSDRASRIRDLEAMADAQRLLVVTQIAELAESARPLEMMRSSTSWFASTLYNVRGFFGGLRSGGGLKGLFSRASRESTSDEAADKESRQFPWQAALTVGICAVQVIRWVVQKRRAGGLG